MSGKTNSQNSDGGAPPRPKHRVLIVDDHALVRRGLAGLIAEEPDLEVCGEAADQAGALRLVEQLKPDLAIIDIALREGNGIELTRQIKSRVPSVRTLITSMHDERMYAERAMRAGAMGFVNKQESADRTVDAIRRVLAGKVYLSDQMVDHLLHRMVETEEQLARSAITHLSDRELEVFVLIGQGRNTRQVAEQLRLSPKTIDTHRQRIKQKLNLQTNNELVYYAAKWAPENG